MRAKHPQNTTPRIYETIGNTDLRFGKFYNPNEGIQGTPEKFELRITNPDPEFMTTVFEMMKDWMRS